MFENAHHLLLFHTIYGASLMELTSPMGKVHTPY